ncbi:hypothetical protein TrVFT333_005636 [Trichoderma virens FT-333]|nr:hypothetical protein TrVFT333_005636 [Trichoderma virens FT-333]
MALKFRRPAVPVQWLIPLLVVNLFVINLGLSISSYPSTKLWQDIICKHHLSLSSDELLPESECHDRVVQRELNIVDIGQSVSVTLGSALVALPLGMLSDRVGRVPILALSIMSLFLAQGYGLLICWKWRQIPLRAIWGSGAIMLLGGGRGVAEAMVFTSISDVMPESKRNLLPMGRRRRSLIPALRPPNRKPPHRALHLAPLLIQLGLIAIGGIVLILFMPETLPSRIALAHISEDTPIINNTNDSKSALASTKSTLTALFRRPAICLLPGAVLAMPAVTSQFGIIMRIMPIRFDWPLSRTSLLFSLNAAVTLLTLLVILPVTSYLLHRNTSISALERDRLLARASVLLFVLGSLFLMIGSKVSLFVLGLVISGLGSGVPTLCRTLLVALVGEHRTGSVFGVIAAGEVLGMLACELIIGPLFDVGLRSWLGFPFCLGMAISVATCLLTWSVRKGDIRY